MPNAQFKRLDIDGPEAAGLADALRRYWNAAADSGLDDAETASAVTSLVCAWIVGYASRGDHNQISELVPVVAEAARIGSQDACSLALKLLTSRHVCK